MMLNDISPDDRENIFVDTNILIRKIEEKPESIKFKKLAISKRFYATEFSKLEFKRAYLKYYFSLYSFIIDNNNDLDVACNRIREMTSSQSTQKKKDAEKWLDILEHLEYSEKDKNSIIARINTLMRFELMHEFEENVNFIDSVLKCDLINLKTRNHRKFITKINCSGCKNHSNGIDKRILGKIHSELIVLDDNELIEMCRIIEKIFRDEKLNQHDCKLIGDVVISIDAPNEMTIHTSNYEHLNPICSSLNKKVVSHKK